MLGVILGGRVGYVLFYQFSYFIENPLYLFRIDQGGMSFHGGTLGVITAIAIFAYKRKKSLLQVGDFVAPLVPVGLLAGRIGNFINGELWGRTTDVPWAMVFPTGGPLARHPSQLYEAFFEGLVLFVILLWPPTGMASSSSSLTMTLTLPVATSFERAARMTKTSIRTTAVNRPTPRSTS